MPLNSRDWIFWGLSVAAAACAVGAAVTAAPNGWGWPAFYTSAGTALAGLAKLVGPTSSQ